MQNDGGRLFGYARVSTKTQNTDRQVDALKAYGVDEHDLYIDKASGKNFDRPRYTEMKNQLRTGDIVVVQELDRLGRNYTEMAEEWNNLTKTKGCDVVILNCDALSTLRKDSDLDKRFIADMMFSLLSYFSERERRAIRQRQLEGIEAARKKGTKFGRPAVERPSNFSEVYGRVLRREITNKQAMEQLGLKRNCYYQFVRQEDIKNAYERLRHCSPD